MSRLIYNSIELSHIKTQSIHQEPVMDKSNTDIEGWRFTLRVKSIIAKGHPPCLPGEHPSAALARIRHHLMTNRQRLVYFAGGDAEKPAETLMFDISTKGTPDIKNGPTVKAYPVTQISNDTFLVDFEVTFVIRDCNGFAATGPLPWVSHRWTETIELDHAGTAIQKVRRGTIVANSSVVSNPDVLRPLVVPPIEAGFARQVAKYTIQEDNLALAYEFVDEEVYLQAPSPAYKASGRYRETSGESGMRFGEANVKLLGNKNSDPYHRHKLLATAIQICFGHFEATNIERLNSPDRNNPNRPRIIASSLEVNFYGIPEVDVSVKARIVPTPVPAFGRVDGSISTIVDQLERPGRNPSLHGGQTPPAIADRGSANLTLVAAALKDPCGLAVPLGTAFAGALPTPFKPPTVKPPTAPTVDTVPAGTISYGVINPAHRGITDEYQTSQIYDRDEGIVMCGTGEEGGLSTPLALYAPKMTKTVAFRASNYGKSPVIPKPIRDDPNLILLAEEVDPGQLEPTADGSDVRYEVKGRYVYGVIDPRKVKPVAAIPPYMKGLPQLSGDVLNYVDGTIMEPTKAKDYAGNFFGDATTTTSIGPAGNKSQT